MMFKLPGTPSPYADAHELADYAEWVCWRNENMSQTALAADLGRLAENYYGEVEEQEIYGVDEVPDVEKPDFDGVDEEPDVEGVNEVPIEEDIARVVEEAYGEIERREVACRGGYPFALDRSGSTLHARQASDNHKYDIYKYLLLATRLDMQKNRSHAKIDGTKLLEELAAEVAQSYFGPRAEKLVFGTTAGSPSFPAKVNTLCKQMQEGVRFVSHIRSYKRIKDGKLDVVAWIPFADNLPGKLIAFGQCKTGTTYEDALPQLQPDAFCKKWLHQQPVLTPTRMFFLAEALPSFDWDNDSIDAGLLFDRCRIVDFSDDIRVETLEKVAAWTAAAQADQLTV